MGDVPMWLLVAVLVAVKTGLIWAAWVATRPRPHRNLTPDEVAAIMRQRGVRKPE